MADYWLDKDNGDNGNTGLSKLQAWATFAYAMTQMSSSDSLTVVKAATAYNESGGFDLAAFGNTQESHRVIIQGEDPTDRPTLSATGQTQTILDLHGNLYITIQDIIFDGADAGWNGVKGDDCQNLIVQRCKMANVKHGYTQNTSSADAEDISILDCEMTALQATGDGVIINGPADGIYIKRNYLHDPGAGDDGIQVQHTSSPYQIQNVEIEDNVILDSNDDSIILQPCLNGTVRGNYISGGGNDGIFIQHPDNVEIYDNVVVNQQDSGIRVKNWTTDGGFVTSAKIHHNVVLNCNLSLSFWSGIYVEGYDGSGDDLEVYSNTVYNMQGDAGGEGKGIRVRLETTTTSGTIVGYIMNNISRDNNDDGTSFEGGFAGTVTLYHGGNCNYNNGASDFDDPNGWGDNSGLAADITTDPQHIDPANNDFNLAPSSPCIGTGDDQFPSRNGKAPSMGAREVGAPVTRPFGTAGRPARMRYGKYYRGPSGNPQTFELVRMEG